MIHDAKYAAQVVSVFIMVYWNSIAGAGPSDALEKISIQSHQPSVYHIYVGTTPVHHHTPTLVTSAIATASVTQQIQTPSGAMRWWQWAKDAVRGAQDTTGLRVYIKNSSWWSYITAHKWSLGIKALGCIYCLLNYRLFMLNTYLADQGRWFLWKRRSSLMQLIHLPEDELVHELIETMRLKRAHAIAEGDHEEMLQIIITEIDEELKTLEQYRWYVARVHTCDEFQRQFGVMCECYIPSLCGISWGYMLRKLLQVVGVRSFFYLNQHVIDDIPAWIERLHYLREVLERTIEQKSTRALPVFLKKRSWYTT